MVVVADTSLINYLVLPGCVDILAAIYQQLVVPLASRRGLLDLPETMNKLRQTSFYVSEDLVERLLELDRRRSS